jgi:hypothetical protein
MDALPAAKVAPGAEPKAEAPEAFEGPERRRAALPQELLSQGTYVRPHRQ